MYVGARDEMEDPSAPFGLMQLGLVHPATHPVHWGGGGTWYDMNATYSPPGPW